MENPRIIYEDKNFIAVLKPAGLLTHPFKVPLEKGSAACLVRSRPVSGVKSAPFSLLHKPEVSNGGKMRIAERCLTDWLLKKYPEVARVGDNPAMRPGIVHRLDRDVSGVLLVARTQAYFLYLKGLFKSRGITKTYLALVYGEVNPVREFVQSAFSNGVKEKRGTIDTPIGIQSGTVKRATRGKDLKMLKTAVTEYRLLKSYILNHKSFSLLEVYPKTGRTHQIRVHLASIGHPIVGDRLYGGGKRFMIYDLGFMNTKRIMLHALSLEFTTEEGKRIKIEAEPPQDFKEILGDL